MQQDNSTPDHGERRGEDAPERLCAVTRRTCDPAKLLRFVAAPDGAIVPDLAGKLPGKGVWLSATRAIVLQAVRQKAFARSLKREVTASEKLADLVGDLMLRRVLDSLAIANKAGLVLCGSSKIDRALERGTVFALVHASDGAADGIRKLDQKFVHVLREAGVAEVDRDRRTQRFLTSQELSLAIGRTNVVHAGLRAGGASRTFLSEAERLLRYRLGVTAIRAA
jgi:uncharacterized protein